MNAQKVYARKFMMKKVIPPEICEEIAIQMDKEKALGNRIRTHKVDNQITNAETVAMTKIFKDIHFKYTEIAENYFQKTLIPTNDYSRIYTKGAQLIPHTDGAHCEYSMTLNIKNDPQENIWPFNVVVYRKDQDAKPRTDKAEFMMEQGDGVFYYGPDQIHWRDELKFDKCYQLFLHWVDAAGSYSHLGNKEYYEYIKLRNK